MFHQLLTPVGNSLALSFLVAILPIAKEGTVLARTFLHSVVLTLVLVIIVMAQQYVWPGIIPSYTAP
jgi:hypothetical protein